jgi:uncharacterized protein (TIGR02118 family)
MTMLSRREDLSPAAFSEHWYGKHAGIVRRMPQLHGYLQNHILRLIGAPVGDASFSVDGIPELWFVDEAAKTAALSSPAAKELPVDEKNFMRGITIFAIEETVLREGQGAAKVMVLARMGSGGASAVDEARAWCGALPEVRRCVVNRIVTADHRPGVWHEPLPPDAIFEFRFDSVAAAETAFRSDRPMALADSLVRRGGSASAYLVEERRIV